MVGHYWANEGRIVKAFFFSQCPPGRWKTLSIVPEDFRSINWNLWLTAKSMPFPVKISPVNNDFPVEPANGNSMAMKWGDEKREDLSAMVDLNRPTITEKIEMDQISNSSVNIGKSWRKFHSLNAIGKRRPHRKTTQLMTACLRLDSPTVN